MQAAASIEDTFGRIPQLMREADITVAIGPVADLSAGVSGSGSVGVAFDGRDIGFFRAVGIGAGLTYGFSLTLQISVVKGSVHTLGGSSHAVILGGGPGIAQGVVAALFSADGTREFVGISVGGGIHLGVPVELYYELQKTWMWGELEPAAQAAGSSK